MIEGILYIQMVVFLVLAGISWLAIFAGWFTEESAKEFIKSMTDIPTVSTSYPLAIQLAWCVAFIVWLVGYVLAWFLFNYFIFKDEQ